MTDSVRVRFAPSPTGHLHIGGARTAIYNWAFARRSGGTFILRIDDTDPERSTEENTQAILRSLRWLGIDWDEGPEVGGPVGPYFQTARAESYVHALEMLKSAGAAYPCFCTAEQLEAKRGDARTTGGTAGYDRTCRALDPASVAERVAAGEPHVWRLAVPADRTEVSFVDAIRGDMSFPASALDDFVLVRTDGTPTYNFATVADDAAIGITHVVGGDDHLSNTARQILVFEGLGATVPEFAHLSMIWGPDGKRLSKRHGATSVEAYREEGYLPEALLNYLALLGWSLDGETTIISRDALLKNFSLDRVSRNPAIFDAEKLDWMNGVYIRELPASEFVDRVAPFLVRDGLVSGEDVDARRRWLEQLAPLVNERVKHLDEVSPAVAFLLSDAVTMDPAAVEKILAKDGAPSLLEACANALASVDPFDAAGVKAALLAVAESAGVKPKEVFQAVRVAVSGTVVSPPLFESLELLGKERTTARLQAARELVEP
jgi:glutamyl-tRNA synthetase